MLHRKQIALSIATLCALLLGCDRQLPATGKKTRRLTRAEKQQVRDALETAAAGMSGNAFQYDEESLEAWQCESCPEPQFPRPKPEQDKPDADRTGAPYFVVKSDDPKTDRLPLKNTRADVSIVGNVAEVRVTQMYKNEGKSTLEAIYTFPASTRAAVHAMRMTIGKRVIEAQIAKKEEARREYEHAKQEGKTASLLEQQRPNVFTMNVANILSGDRIKVEMIYNELLVPEDNVFEFVYPTVVGPRFVDKTDNQEKWTATPYQKEGEKPTYTFGLNAVIRSPLPVTCLGSRTHAVSTFTSNDAEAVVTLDESVEAGNRDFILRYSLASERIESGVLLLRGNEENFFMVLASPPRKVSPQQVLAREYIFVVDVSGSMHGFPLDVSRKLLEGLLSSLRKQDRFNILFFSGGTQLMAEKSVPATAQNIARANEQMSSLRGGGGTRLKEALQRAIDLPDADGASRVLVVITDGYVGADRECIELIRGNLNRVSVFAYGIGSSVNRYLIESMAHAGAGQPFVVTDQEQAEKELPRFRRYIDAPVMSNARISFEGFDAYEVQPEVVPAVFAGRPVVVLGKFRGEPAGKLMLTGKTANGELKADFDIAKLTATKQTEALRYLWAREAIRHLSDLGDPRQQDKEVTEKVTGIGLKYSLLTQFTSFVAVDSIIRADGKLETVKQPLPLPKGVPNTAVGEQGRARTLIYTARGSLNDVLAGGALVGNAERAMAQASGVRVRRTPKASRAPSKDKEAVVAPRPRIESGKITVKGALSEELVRRFLGRHLGRLQPCYQRQLTTNPSLKGTITLRIEVSASGRVANLTLVRSTLKHTWLEQCILNMAKRWVFPAPEGGGKVVITVPIQLEPTAAKPSAKGPSR